MPELPDVEGFRRTLDSCARDRRIARVDVIDPGVLHETTPQRMKRSLAGRRFSEPERHGKWLIAHTDGPTVLVHFGMTGELLRSSGTEPRAPHDRVVFELGDGEQLRYRDQRKLRGIWLAESDTAVDRVLREQGPDALAVDEAEFTRRLAGRRGGIKPALTDQSVLAGLGNLLGDEILWRACVHPARKAGDLSDEERHRIFTETRRVLRSSVRAGRIPTARSWLTGRRDAPDPVCPRCGTHLRRTRIGGRGSVWCPRCQPAPAYWPAATARPAVTS